MVTFFVVMSEQMLQSTHLKHMMRQYQVRSFLGSISFAYWGPVYERSPYRRRSASFSGNRALVFLVLFSFVSSMKSETHLTSQVFVLPLQGIPSLAFYSKTIFRKVCERSTSGQHLRLCQG